MMDERREDDHVELVAEMMVRYPDEQNLCPRWTETGGRGTAAGSRGEVVSRIRFMILGGD